MRLERQEAIRRTGVPLRAVAAVPVRRGPRIGLALSAAAHLGLVLWAILGGVLFRPPEAPFDFAMVAVVSGAEFAALQAAAAPPSVPEPATAAAPPPAAQEAAPVQAPSPELPLPAMAPPPGPEMPVVLASPDAPPDRTALLAPAPPPSPEMARMPEPAPDSAPRQQRPAAPAERAAPGPARQAAPPGQASAARQGALQADWGAAILARIARQQRYPAGASGSGTARVMVTIGRDGRLGSLRLAASSGNAAFDRAALDAVQRAGRFPAAPRGLTDASYSFAVPMTFRRN